VERVKEAASKVKVSKNLYNLCWQINMLHCLVQTDGIGGESQLTDALHIAKKLKRETPEIYKVLTETPVDWCDIGLDGGYSFYCLYRSPVIL
jgi:gamma-butyrobetaine dioxygenase